MFVKQMQWNKAPSSVTNGVATRLIIHCTSTTFLLSLLASQAKKISLGKGHIRNIYLKLGLPIETWNRVFWLLEHQIPQVRKEQESSLCSLHSLFQFIFPSKQHVIKSTSTRWDQAWCRLPSAIILPQVWWLLSPEERGKHVWLHTLLGSILCLAWPSFVGGREGWGQPNHLWFGSQGWPRESLGGDLFCLGVMRWQAGALTALHTFLFCCKGPGRGW